ncbi:hypothetical protein ACLOJK_004346 [Asimina triloba]
MPSSTNPAINDHRAGQRHSPSDLPWTAITSRRPARTEIHPDHEAPVHLQQSKLQRKIRLQIHGSPRRNPKLAAIEDPSQATVDQQIRDPASHQRRPSPDLELARSHHPSTHRQQPAA